MTTKKSKIIRNSKKMNRIKLQLLWGDGRKCAICGKKIHSLDDLTIDHIIPLAKGGQDELENCQLTHKLCNTVKGDSMPKNYCIRKNLSGIIIYSKKQYIHSATLAILFGWTTFYILPIYWLLSKEHGYYI